MKLDPRYAQWLLVADELERLHQSAYGPGALLEGALKRSFGATPRDAAVWLRKKCASGGWYWWDKRRLEARANRPLQSLLNLIIDGRWDLREDGRILFVRTERLQRRIADINEGTPFQAPPSRPTVQR